MIKPCLMHAMLNLGLLVLGLIIIVEFERWIGVLKTKASYLLVSVKFSYVS
jgi:hypothetical protein